jgi:hypothetical protein
MMLHIKIGISFASGHYLLLKNNIAVCHKFMQ